MKKWITITVIAIVFLGIGFGVQQWLANDRQQTINEKEATEMIQSLYDASVTKIIPNDHYYDMQIKNDLGVYTVQMNRHNGDITALTLVDKNKLETNSDDQAVNEQTSTAKISEEKAAEIALSKVSGEVDDIDLESVDGSKAYKIEIETDTEDAIVYVQAYTGEILSFTFEKDDD